ncbi:uncharacterized protein LOC142854075 [Microtus pennsylvanicus]|uniref:uncharacterized protein LOC142854075 n=1 Tax=Microtus pennsylvanicus TaxID=10058 RepID=UPI003F6D1124
MKRRHHSTFKAFELDEECTPPSGQEGTIQTAQHSSGEDRNRRAGLGARDAGEKTGVKREGGDQAGNGEARSGCSREMASGTGAGAKPGLAEAGLSPVAFRRLHTGSPLRLQRLVQDRWLSAVRPETRARFRPERVGGDTLAAPGPPPARRGRPRPVPPRPAAAPPSGPFWGRGQFGACPARDPARSWLACPSPRAEAVLSRELGARRGLLGLWGRLSWRRPFGKK